MNRTEFETQMLEDPELRQELEELRAYGEEVRELQARLAEAREVMHQRILWLVASKGAPLSLLADIADLSRPRISQILKEGAGRVQGAGEVLQQDLPSAERTIGDALREGLDR